MTSRTTTKAPARGPAQQQGTRNVPATVQPGRNLPTKLDYGNVGGVGLEDAGRDSFAIPFIQVLQKLSPQVDRASPQFIKGAKNGDIINTATGEIFPGDEGIIVIPAHYKRSFVAWTIREKGGGFRGEYAEGDPILATTTKDTKGRDMLPDGITQIVDTRLFGVILLSASGAAEPGLISMYSTQIKKAKRWCTMMSAMQSEEERLNGRKLPIFAHKYKLTTTPESNDKGNWDGWVIEHAGYVDQQAAYDAGVDFYTSLKSGKAKLNPGAAEGAGQPEY